jgi:putative FmdB family regulatory protein
MPIYEYQCRSCRKIFSRLVLGASSAQQPACPKCGSAQLDRLMSRFATAQSGERRMEKLADPSSFSGLDENDPSSVARWAKKMGREMGDEAGEGFDEMVDQAMDEETGKKGGADGDAGGGDDLY